MFMICHLIFIFVTKNICICVILLYKIVFQTHVIVLLLYNKMYSLHSILYRMCRRILKLCVRINICDLLACGAVFLYHNVKLMFNVI